MAHFVKLDANNIVTEVVVVNNDVVRNEPFPVSEPIGIEFCRGLYGADTDWAQTSYNASFRYHYAGIEYTFDPSAAPDGAFIPPQPYPSWILTTATYTWVAPVPIPSDGHDYVWDEALQQWARVVEGDV